MGKKSNCGHKKYSVWTIEQVECYARLRGFELLSEEYFNVRSKLNFKCSKGHVFNMRWNDFCNGQRCSFCSGSHALSIEDVRKKMDIDGYVLLSKTYKNNSIKLKMKCQKGHIIHMAWNNFSSGKRCSVCYGNSVLTKKIVNDRLIAANRTVKLIGKYMGAATPTDFSCLVCNHAWKTSPSNVYGAGTGCPKCARNILLTKKIINNRLDKKNRKVRLVGEYINANTRTDFLCLICGLTWRTTAASVEILGSGCPSCATSGFSTSRSATLYYLRVVHRRVKYYKIGVTNRTVQERYRGGDSKKVTILKEWFYENGSTALKKEQSILKIHSKYRYRGATMVLQSNGDTELFTEDVLGLEK